MLDAVVIVNSGGSAGRDSRHRRWWWCQTLRLAMGRHRHRLSIRGGRGLTVVIVGRRWCCHHPKRRVAINAAIIVEGGRGNYQKDEKT